VSCPSYKTGLAECIFNIKGAKYVPVSITIDMKKSYMQAT